MGLSSTRLWRSFSKTELRTSAFSSAANSSTMRSPSPSPPASWATIWLHGLGDNGPNNAPIQKFFNFPNMKWHFPSAPFQPVSCNYGSVMPSWFDIEELPFTAESPVDEEALLVAVKKVHEMLDKQVEEGIKADKIFLCGALSLASALSYPKRLAGAAVFSGWVPFKPTFLVKATGGKQTPILWQHGMNDPTVHFEAGQAGPPLLASHGINCEFKAYPGLQHSISSEELTYLGQWLKAQMEL
ncbi:hypothetical protein L7F22_062134 [Adiantum nelumboides]|nr:hypothetical protein [Adiantum nelumboides]